MKSSIKSKPFILLILFTTIMFIAISTNASNISNSVSNAEHNQIIQQYIDKIKNLQEQIFYLNEYNLESSPENKAILSTRIPIINNEIEELRREISNYIEVIPTLSTQNRDIALVFNALTFVKNSLYQLSILSNATSAVDKNVLLEDFYLAIRSATDTLNTLEDLMTRE